MGKGGGKKGRAATKKKQREPKVKGLPKAPRIPRPVDPEKVAKKLESKERKKARLLAVAIEAAKKPEKDHLLKNLVHAKWPAMFKRQIGLIESHIKGLDRVMQSLKTQMSFLPESERLDWELGERGQWRVMCGLMDRARDTLTAARRAARGMLPDKHLRDKKGLGVVGEKYEPMVPKLDEKCAAIGYDPTGKGKLGRTYDEFDADGDTSMSDSSDSSDSDSDAEDGVKENTDFVKLDNGKEAPRYMGPLAGEEVVSELRKKVAEETQGAGFFIDTNPTPVNLNTAPAEPKMSRSQRRAIEKEARVAARLEKKRLYHERKEAEASRAAANPEPEANAEPEPAVDFNALEAKLQAEIEAGTRAQQEAEASVVSQSSKKRRRSDADGEVVVEKKAKKEKEKKRKAEDSDEDAAEKKAKLEKDKKRKAEDSGDEEVTEKKVRKEKKEKKEKKRKAESAEVEEPAQGKKKKRKHKAGEDSE